MGSFTVEELAIPASLDGPDGADFVASAEVRNAVEAAGYGTTELNYSAEELHPGWLDMAYEPKRLLAARVGGRIVARAVYETLATDAEVAWAEINVLPDFRRRGIGSALAEELEQIGRDGGRSKLISYAFSGEAAGERMPAPTGYGSVPLSNPEVQFLLGRGYTLEQVSRGSRLALPVEAAELRRRYQAAAAASGSDFSVHYWGDRTPERWQADMAELYTRMSTEVPQGELGEPEDVWTVERLVDAEDREAASPRTMLNAVVEHRPTGRLVAYTELSVPAETERAVSQEDTLVLPEHRGHRLGMLLKVANILNLQEARPGHPAIITFNAEENRHMLAVNEDVGFVPIGHEGAWKKLL